MENKDFLKFVHGRGISKLTASVHPSYFLKAKLLENILRVFSSKVFFY
jgi:hypothetical protein